jgi:hypothetical protein
MPLRFPWSIVAWVVAGYHAVAAWVVVALHAVSKHTGIPLVVVAGLALVLSFRFVRRAARLALEVGVVVGLLLVATELGWIHW